MYVHQCGCVDIWLSTINGFSPQRRLQSFARTGTEPDAISVGRCYRSRRRGSVAIRRGGRESAAQHGARSCGLAHLSDPW